MTAAAVIEALALLPKVTIGVQQFITWLAGVRSSLQQSAEWTVEMDALWREGLLTHGLRPEEIPDAALPNPS